MTPPPAHLPPERPFTPEVGTRLRTPILSETEQPAPRRGRLLVPLAAAAAVLLVVVVSLLVTRVDRGSRLVPAERPELPIPGYTTQQLADITRQCAVSIRALGPVAREVYVGMRLHNVHRDASGLDALFYGPNGSMWCGYELPADPGRRTTAQLRSMGFGPSTWLDTPVQELGGRMKPGAEVPPGPPKGLSYWKSGGQVAPGIVRVQIVGGGRSAQVPVINGTFLATVFASPSGRFRPQYQLIAYRADGSVVRSGRYAGDVCVTTPDGTVLRGNPKQHPEGCVPAIRWR